MKNNLIVMLIGIVTFISCEKYGLDVEAPTCIKNKIEKIINTKVTNPPAQVWKWEVDGTIYYYFTSNCCDQFNYLYNEQCEIVCAPDGGFTGDGDGNCPDFISEITKTLIWEDQRK
ncbi:DUF6970 domain-containing protein [Lutibacter sp.]